MDQTACEPFELASSDGTSTLHGYTWKPEGAPRATVQIVHGMAEHIERYDGFARFLAANGIQVVGHNQIGHGSSSAPEKWGCLPKDNGKEILVEDVQGVRNLANRDQTVAAAPYFVFGHSLGSYITRAYLPRHGDGLAGAVICGTGNVAPFVSSLGNAVARLVCATKGEDTRSAFIDGMGAGGYGKQIKDARTPLDWLSYNQENVDRYIADEQCGFMFSAGGYATVTSLTREVCTPQSAAGIPKDLPLLYISGAEDPVGDCGKGVEAACDLARNAGVKDVSCTIYDGMRHEILNETDRQRVWNDVLSWLNARITPATA
jgi:alpha-beta hydrolase superfamily lysophospholipase